MVREGRRSAGRLAVALAPRFLLGVGPRSTGLASPCQDCKVPTWLRYGNVPLCPPCAERREEGREETEEG